MRPRRGVGSGRWALAASLLIGVAGVAGVRAAPAEASLQAAQRVAVPSLAVRAEATVTLPAHWFAAEGSGPRPAVVLLHGCGGVHDGRGGLSMRLRAYAALLQAEGWHVLVPDSLTPRGETELCTQRNGTRAVTQRERRRDALGALAWLAARPDVDAARMALLGWSHGGSAVLAATNRLHPDAASAPHPRAAVAYYPGCAGEGQRGYQPSAPLLLQLGAADDWTPAAPCLALVEAVRATHPGGPSVLTLVHPGAHHGFDSQAPVRLRPEVPNGARPGQGVHVGGDAPARERSRAALLDFLRAAFVPAELPVIGPTPP